MDAIEARFHRILEAYAAPVRRLCTAWRSNASDQQDLFQEIVIAVWTALPRFRGDASERTWLYRIAHNVAITQRSRSRRRESAELPLDAAAEAPAQAIDARRMDLLCAIRALDPVERELALLYLEGLTAAEIADVLGIAEGNAAVRLTRLRARLTAILNPQPENAR